MIQFASAPESRVRCTTDELQNKDIIGLGQVSTFLIDKLLLLNSLKHISSQSVIVRLILELKSFEGLVEVNCHISDASDSASVIESHSSFSVSRALSDALAQACFAAALKLLHCVTQWDLKTRSSFPACLQISQNLFDFFVLVGFEFGNLFL